MMGRSTSSVAQLGDQGNEPQKLLGLDHQLPVFAHGSGRDAKLQLPAGDTELRHHRAHGAQVVQLSMLMWVTSVVTMPAPTLASMAAITRR